MSKKDAKCIWCNENPSSHSFCFCFFRITNLIDENRHHSWLCIVPDTILSNLFGFFPGVRQLPGVMSWLALCQITESKPLRTSGILSLWSYLLSSSTSYEFRLPYSLLFSLFLRVCRFLHSTSKFPPPCMKAWNTPKDYKPSQSW